MKNLNIEDVLNANKPKAKLYRWIGEALCVVMVGLVFVLALVAFCPNS